jgi:hypothetical protein
MLREGETEREGIDHSYVSRCFIIQVQGPIALGAVQLLKRNLPTEYITTYFVRR